MALTDEERQALMEQMLLSATGSVDPYVVASALAGTSRATQEKLLDPALLLTTGVIDPAALSQALNNYYSSATMAAFDEAVSDWRTEKAKLDAKRPQFVSVAYNDIASGAGLGLLADAELRQDFDALGQGLISVDQFLTKFDDVYSGSADPAVPKLRSDITQFAKDAAGFRQKQLEFETENAGAEAALGDQPTFESVAAGIDLPALKREFFKSQGLEGLELLPDPGATYQFTPEEALQFTNLSSMDLKPKRSDLDALRRMQEERRAAAPTVYESLDARRQAAMEELPVLAGDPMGRTVATPGFGRGAPMAARPEQLAGRGSGRTTAASRRGAAGMEAMPRAVGRPAGLPSAAEKALMSRIMSAKSLPAAYALELEKELARQGRTPFGDIIAQQNIYGRATA